MKKNYYPKKKWYEKSGWIIFWLIVFFPVGLFLMWKYSDWKKIVKLIISVFFRSALYRHYFRLKI